MLPTTIDFRITSRCNMSCPFCFGTKAVHHMNTSAHIDFLRKIRVHGVNNIVLTGGEPTCFPGFIDLLHAIHSMGYRISLSTNGSFWDNVAIRNAIFENVSFISLPIESSVSAIHNSLRLGIPNHFELVQRIIQEMSMLKLDTQLKISTVVTKTNIDSLSGILDTLPIEPSIWKLYQLSSCQYNRQFYASNCISEEQFTKCVEQLQCQYFDRTTRIVSGYELDRDRKYLFLDPDGSIKTIIQNNESVIGHVSEEEYPLYQRINEMIDPEKINSNFLNSFT